ncbi:MAG: 30S ribosomal protein S6 [Proteobacteria bacterium]|nr:30S ribosomal protein S6 [Pseudomonadota bacterium]
MREYETVVITRADLPESDQKQIHDRCKTFVEKREGRLFYARNMGKRNLAYPIKKQQKGLYTCYDYAAGGSTVSEIERSLRLDDNVLRFLTVVRKEDVDVEARAAEIVARGEDVAAPVEEAAPRARPAFDDENGYSSSGRSREEE